MRSSVLLVVVVAALVQSCFAGPGQCGQQPQLEDCGPEFQGKCTCGMMCYLLEWNYVVNCTDTHFTDAHVLEHLPLKTEVLIFQGNHIPELPCNVFGTLNDYAKLKVVDMSNNGIKVIRGKSYHHVSNVERLILNHNELVISSEGNEPGNHHPRIFSNFVSLMELHLTNAFAENTPTGLAEDLHDIFVKSNLTQLIKLHLEQNEIYGFKDAKVFCDLPKLMDLHLGNNNLHNLDFDVECLEHLRFLDLEMNKISAISSKDLDTLDLFPKNNQSLLVDFGGNPFSCDCGINEFHNWLKTTKVTVRNKESLLCYMDSSMSQVQPITRLKNEVCSLGPLTESDAQSHTAPVLITFLVFLLLLFLVVVVYLNWMTIKTHMSPVWTVMDTVSRKVHYTSIGKQEDEEMHV